MADWIDFTEHYELPDVEELDGEALKALLEEMRGRIAQLDEQEPEDMDSEEYQLWGDAHEMLEDMAETIEDRLEELGC